MKKLEIIDIKEKINDLDTFSAQSADGSFSIVIEEFVPCICTAIHNGNQFRDDLQDVICLTALERWYEEDPHTGKFFEELPIRIVANDSRYQYDLNRSPDNCIYDTAWGKKVWKHELPEHEWKISINRHENFYSVIDTLITKLEEEFNGCIVYDMHSFNYRRSNRKKEMPEFNIGTKLVRGNEYKSTIKHWMRVLSEIDLKEFPNRVAENDVFQGRGYFTQYITDNFMKTLVLCTEIKKIYCDENTGKVYNKVIDLIKSGMKKAITENTEFFIKSFNLIRSR